MKYYLNIYEYMHLYVQIYLHKEELLFINLYVVGTFYPNKNYMAWFIFIMSDCDCFCLKEYKLKFRKES